MSERIIALRRGILWVVLSAVGVMGLITTTIADESKPADAKPDPDAKPKPKVVKLPKRPARTVVEATMTPADLDALIDGWLEKKLGPGVEPPPTTNDLEFVRRIHLDVAGVPPTPTQVTDFLQDESPDKRARLIDELLASPEHARNWSRYWREVVQFRASNINVQQARFDKLESWLAEQFERNRPWDEIAAEVITATGRTDENGATAFSAAHSASPVQLAGEASRVFLGVQIQCAECHDHKTDSWKREQFHELAAFFAGGRLRRVVKPSKDVRAAFAIETQPRARYTMPDLADPAKMIPVKPRFFLASTSTATRSESSTETTAAPRIPDGLTPAQLRELAASYITGQDNPWFARAYVNRTWAVLMGEGFYELVDDLGPERDSRGGPEILFPLADQWRDGGYDVRWLFRTILNTRAYQQRTSDSTTDAAMQAAACPTRLRSDQIFEALAAALDVPLAAPSTPGATQAAADSSEKKPAVRPVNLRTPVDKLFGVDPSTLHYEVLGTIPQALYLMNSAVVHTRTLARPNTSLGAILNQETDDLKVLETLYMRVLSRRPNPNEVDVFASYRAEVGDRKEAFEDVYWSLVNSTEFLSRR